MGRKALAHELSLFNRKPGLVCGGIGSSQIWTHGNVLHCLWFIAISSERLNNIGNEIHALGCICLDKMNQFLLFVIIHVCSCPNNCCKPQAQELNSLLIENRNGNLVTFVSFRGLKMRLSGSFMVIVIIVFQLILFKLHFTHF